MQLRSVVIVCTFFLVVAISGATAAPLVYEIDFTGGGPGLVSIGPGSFSFDSTGLSGTIGPPVLLPDYMVPAVLTAGPTIPTFPVIFTQTSPEDDALQLGGGGLVTALDVDSSQFGTVLQLNLNNTWTLGLVPAGVSGVAQSGTYTISLAPTDVPEPASIGLIGAGLAGLVLVRRKYLW